MKNEEFWKWFPEERLKGRGQTFRKMFEYLDAFDRPVTIVETGCCRRDPALDYSWEADGCSTILFDMYCGYRNDGSRGFAVDVNPDAVNACRARVALMCVHIDDSVGWLKTRGGWNGAVTEHQRKHWPRAHLLLPGDTIDLLYLDSMDLDRMNPMPSAAHHLAELTAALPMLRADSLVVVDDSPPMLDSFPRADVSGKGEFVARYANGVGATLQFHGYQCGWTNLTGRLGVEPEDLKELTLRARAQVEAGNMPGADSIYRNLLFLTLPPWTPLTKIIRGEACAFFARQATTKKWLALAVHWYNEALQADPAATDYRLELIRRCWVPLALYDVALTEAKRCVEIEPDHAESWGVLGRLYHELNNTSESVKAFEKAIELRGKDNPDAALDYASMLMDLADYDRVRELCEAARGTERWGDAVHMLAMVAYRENKFERSIELYDEAIARGCFDSAIAKWHKSHPLESIGRYREAAEMREWRKYSTRRRDLAMPVNRFAAPLWTLDSPRVVDGRQAVVHVHAESGAGDNIALMRFLPLIQQMGFIVRYEVQSGMLELARQSFPEIEVVPPALNYPGTFGLKFFDYQISVGSLMHAFGTEVHTVPWDGPYLRADPEAVEALHDRHPVLMNKGNIGFCWSSGIRRQEMWLETYGTNKSMHFDELMPLVKAMAGERTLVSLQVGPERKQRRDSVVDLLPEKPTWADTAALVECLDLVITVDTGVAHLAGAMGKPVWVMMHTQGSWHWMAERPGASWNERSPWYPSARIFRQKTAGDWLPVVYEIASELRKSVPLGRDVDELEVVTSSI